MFKNRLLIFLFCLIVGEFFSQQNDKISFESGFALDIAFKKEGSSSKPDLSSSYFSKFEYAGKSWANEKWSIFMPFGISYLHLTNTYTFEFSGFNVTYHNLNLFFGPQIQHQSKKIRIGLGVFVNGMINLHTQIKESISPTNANYYSSNNFTGFGGYLNSRLFLLYKISKKTWIGPSCDLYFLDFLYAYSELAQRKNSNYQKASLFGVSGSSLWVNPGLKLQIDLK